MRAETIDGGLTYLQTRIVTHCLDGSSWTLRLTMFASEFQKTGDIVYGQQGPALTTSDQGEPVRVATRVRTEMYHNPVGTILSEVTRSPGPHSVYCSSYELDYTLSHATDRRLGELGATCPLVPRCFQSGICWPYEPTAENNETPDVLDSFRRWAVSDLRRAPLDC